MNQWETVIGLEVHVQLDTNSKIFCGCSTATAEEPNTNVCPVCLGMPGTLPVLNEQVVAFGVRTGLALGCTINLQNEIARKNYFYPDLPKGYQISQFDKPICEGGIVEIVLPDGTERTINLTRIHMEEDAGKSVHGEGADTASYVDFNRTGIPLLEIVSEPEMRSAAEAAAYLRSLHQVVRYIGVSEANMELGQFRCDANVSIRPVGQQELGTKAELKNMNSFRNVEKAIEYEISRQIALCNQGGSVVQETRLWDAGTGKSRAMRGKEEAHDYRYFPEPDLLPLVLEPAYIEQARASLPELPRQRRQRYQDAFGLGAYDAALLTGDRTLAEYYENILQGYDNPKKAANWVTTEILRAIKGEGSLADFPVNPADTAILLCRIDDGTISAKMAKEVFAAMVEEGKSADTIIEEKGLKQVSDSSEIEGIVREIFAANPNEVTRLAAGENKLIGFFVGQIMKATQGKANPALANELIRKLLAEHEA